MATLREPQVWTPQKIAARCGLSVAMVRYRIRQAVKREIVPPQNRPIAYNSEQGERILAFIQDVSKNNFT